MIRQPSALEEAVSKAGKKTGSLYNRGADIVKNFIKTSTQDVQNFTNNFDEGLKANVRALAQNKAFDSANKKAQIRMIQNDMNRFLQNPANAVTTAIKSIPANLARAGIDRDKRTQKPMTMQQFEAEDQAAQDQYNRQFPPIMRSDTTDSMFMPWGWDAQPAGTSAQLQPRKTVYLQPPSTDPALEKIKQQILSDPNITDATRAYLKDIPITYENMTDENGKLLAAGMAHEPGGPGRYIGISDSYKENPTQVAVTNQVKKQSVQIPNGELETIIRHELLHQAPKGIPLGTFKSENKDKVNNYIQRWGKKYMSNPGALVEEMFAEKDLPSVYYWHIYKSIVPDATPKNFIDTIKSVFAEPDRFAPEQKSADWNQWKSPLQPIKWKSPLPSIPTRK